MNGSFYPPQPSSGFILGDYGQGNYNAPIGPTFYIVGVENDDPHVAIYAMGFLNVIFAYPSYGGIYFAVPILVPTPNQLGHGWEHYLLFASSHIHGRCAVA